MACVHSSTPQLEELLALRPLMRHSGEPCMLISRPCLIASLSTPVAAQPPFFCPPDTSGFSWSSSAPRSTCGLSGGVAALQMVRGTAAKET